MAQLSWWLERRRLPAKAVTADVVAQFLAWRRRNGRRGSPRTLVPVLGYLRRIAAIPTPLAAVRKPTPMDTLLARFDDYLHRERDLAAATAAFYHRVAQQLLVGRFGTKTLPLAELTAADISAFVLREASRWSVSATKYTVTALRALLRFMYVSGEVALDLTGAAPPVAGWRLTAVPRHLPSAELQQLLRSCDRRTHVGRRDYAIVLLLVRLGLRAGEVARLELEDFDWATGELRIRGKGRRLSTLPLPADVGMAVAAYLRHTRRSTSSRRVFLRLRAPVQPMGLQSIAAQVRQIFVRAGLPARGAHCLRHTAATQMLERGATLTEVAQVLRHRSIDTTAIYAKVDHAALRTVVQPWPEAVR
jgi:site-specific recombinase XerD